MHSDHRQPGSKLNRPIVWPSSLMTSTFVLGGVRVSSGELCDLVSNRVTLTGIAIAHLQVERTTARVKKTHVSASPSLDLRWSTTAKPHAGGAGADAAARGFSSHRKGLLPSRLEELPVEKTSAAEVLVVGARLQH